VAPNVKSKKVFIKKINKMEAGESSREDTFGGYPGEHAGGHLEGHYEVHAGGHLWGTPCWKYWRTPWRTPRRIPRETPGTTFLEGHLSRHSGDNTQEDIEAAKN
jgi:hypothetical protein